ncbi:family 43 glycosylhydrolase [Shouchella patagoniensis]|uniref:family 43 glycosylhydrolase n=1 Tax=Shouchella patagoniensis TaxID=228576 RepID=UPI001475AD6D|nr:family 43 glycosylhydrolase [Shouchella patagoniensis]
MGGLCTSLKGEWKDEGEVFKTSYESVNNAIDPHIALSKESIPYLVYGSFFDGIYMSEIDQKSGKLKSYGCGKCIACREFESKEGAVEGAFILFNRQQDMYYLFVSYPSWLY